MISWQQKESDRLLCVHESALHRNHVNYNQNKFWIDLFKDRQGDIKNFIPYDLSKIKKDDQTKYKDKNDLFYKQTYLSSHDFSCEIYQHLQHK